ERGGEFFLSRAEMLEAAGRAQEATLAVVAGLKSPDANAAVYRRALALAVKRKRSEDAVAWMEMGASAQKDNDAILLLEADAYEFAGRSADAERAWTGVENRRPEESAAWMEQGIALAAVGKCEAARAKLETAITLGARNVAIYYYAAECAGKGSAAEAAVGQAVAAAPEDAWVLALGGRIAIENGDGKLATARLQKAVKLRPGLADAHRNLARAYDVAGRKAEAAAESAKAKTPSGAQ